MKQIANTIFFGWWESNFKQPSDFFLGIFLVKESPKNTYLYSNFHDEREFHH